MKKQLTTVCPVCKMEAGIHDNGTMFAHGKFKKEGTYTPGLDFPVIWCNMSDKPAPKEEIKS